MEIIKNKPGKEIECRSCTSVYLLQESDVTAFVDIISGEKNIGAPDFCTRWDCPSCGKRAGMWLYELPSGWRDSIKDRSGFMKEKKLTDYIENYEERSRIRLKQTYGIDFNKGKKGFIERILERLCQLRSSQS